ATGTLTWVSPEVDPRTRTVRARAEVDSSAGQLRPGTFGKAKVVVARSPRALTVPDQAVQWDGRAHRVFVRRDSQTFTPQVVLPGARAGGYTELRDSRVLLAAGTAGLLGAGALQAACALAAGHDLFGGPRPGEDVVTTGSHVL